MLCLVVKHLSNMNEVLVSIPDIGKQTKSKQNSITSVEPLFFFLKIRTANPLLTNLFPKEAFSLPPSELTQASFLLCLIFPPWEELTSVHHNIYSILTVNNLSSVLVYKTY